MGVENISGYIQKVNIKTNKANIIQAGMFTSFDRIFHTYADQIISMFKIHNLPSNLLIRINKDNKAKIYIDNFPVSHRVLINTSKNKGQFIYKHEIDDIESVSFSDSINNINPIKGERLIFLFRYNFSFGLYFDLSGNLDPDKALKEIGELYSRLMFYNFYWTCNEKNLQKLIKRGWFPFAGLSEGDCNYILERLYRIPVTWLKQRFNEEWIYSISEKWFRKEVFNLKGKSIKEGLDSFIQKKYIASCSTLIPIIEGLISESYKLDNNKNLGFKDKEILKYLKNKTSLLNLNRLSPLLFLGYLSNYVYKQGMRKKDLKRVNRHTHSHSRVSENEYTLETNVKIILTINQLYYYL